MRAHHYLIIAAVLAVVFFFVPLVGPPSGSGLPKVTLYAKLRSDMA